MIRRTDGRSNAAPVPIASRGRRRKMPCPCGCGAPAMCDEHRARLALVRETLFGGKGRYGQRSDQRPGKKKLGSTCCNPACMQPRNRADRYCIECQEAGWTEEEAA